MFVPGRGLDDQFNSHLADRLVVFIDELNPDSFGSSNIDIIKSMITERNGLTHKKFQDQTVSANLSNFIAATNNEVDLTLTYDNRRFVILRERMSGPRSRSANGNPSSNKCGQTLSRDPT